MSEVRPNMINGAVQLLAQRGLHGASFAEVLELTGAPRGSIYHHFPGGKDELVAAALDAVGTATQQRLNALERTPLAITEGFLEMWSALLDRARLTAGCAVVAVSIAASGALLAHAGAIFRTWTSHLASLYTDAGLDPDVATDLATLLIAATEGAVIMSRAEHDRAPFDRTTHLLLAHTRQVAR